MKIIENTDIGHNTEIAEFTAIKNSVIGDNTKIWRFANIYNSKVGDNCMIGTYVELQKDTIIRSGSRIQSHSFLCSLVEIGRDVFVGHGVMFINDRYPPRERKHWEKTIINDGVVIGSNVTILPVEIGKNALVAAGSVVINDVPENTVVAGNPAKIIQYK